MFQRLEADAETSLSTAVTSHTGLKAQVTDAFQPVQRPKRLRIAIYNAHTRRQKPSYAEPLLFQSLRHGGDPCDLHISRLCRSYQATSRSLALGRCRHCARRAFKTPQSRCRTSPPRMGEEDHPQTVMTETDVRGAFGPPSQEEVVRPKPSLALLPFRNPSPAVREKPGFDRPSHADVSWRFRMGPSWRATLLLATRRCLPRLRPASLACWSLKAAGCRSARSPPGQKAKKITHARGEDLGPRGSDGACAMDH